MPPVEVTGLTKRFGSRTAVAGLSFALKPGQVTGFLGPNGAGKSTTLRMIVGLDAPDGGSATIFGRPYRSLKHPLKTVGALLDAKWAYPSRSVRDHLRWIAAAGGIPASRVAEVLDLVGLASVAGLPARQLSLGMSQRMGVAAALLGEPDVLLFDEPVNGLDPEGVTWIRSLIKELARRGATVLVSSHLLAEMALTADHLVVIGRGVLIADCSVEEFIARATDDVVLVRSPQAEALAEELVRLGHKVEAGEGGALTVHDATSADIGELAARRGFTLHELTARRASLEEAYLKLTESAVEYHSHALPASSPELGAVEEGAAQ
ncbi:MAG: ABC transporter ATP-binding protein [Segniliparus sp.]|uniref:ABC transporter ATP-binding protein n=1 Tax=Segniliparus sp. TaxID=2804064 RepID=UPI003F363282